MKNIILGVGGLAIILVGGYFLIQNFNKDKNQELDLELVEENMELKIEVLEKGDGAEAKSGDTITVHYTGTLLNGTKFDSSVDRGEPFSFTLGQNRVIQGWELGLLGSQAGEKRKLTIPSNLGYGERGAAGGLIPANAVLVFEIQVLEIN